MMRLGGDAEPLGRRSMVVARGDRASKTVDCEVAGHWHGCILGRLRRVEGELKLLPLYHSLPRVVCGGEPGFERRVGGTITIAKNHSI
jgi:hypothetical protein